MKNTNSSTHLGQSIGFGLLLVMMSAGVTVVMMMMESGI